MNVVQLLCLAATIFCVPPTEKSTFTSFTSERCRVYVPNAFSPNNDGVNDEFLPDLGLGCSITDYQLKIYNRSGALVFDTQILEEGWDGNFRNEPSPSAVYYYVMKYTITDCDSSDEELTTGDVALLR
ncbi:MAG: gliding motility-associated C-terminal domain-containing protein [Bacteroidota bacterium]